MGFSWGIIVTSPECPPPDWDPELESHIEGNLATEVAMVVLDTLAVVEQVSITNYYNHLPTYPV